MFISIVCELLLSVVFVLCRDLMNYLLYLFFAYMLYDNW